MTEASHVHLRRIAPDQRDAPATCEEDALVGTGHRQRAVDVGLVVGFLSRAAAALDEEASRADVQLLVAAGLNASVVAGVQGASSHACPDVDAGACESLRAGTLEQRKVAHACGAASEFDALGRYALRRTASSFHCHAVARQGSAAVQAESAAGAEGLGAAGTQQDRRCESVQRNIAQCIESQRTRLGGDLDTRRGRRSKFDARMLWAAERT